MTDFLETQTRRLQNNSNRYVLSHKSVNLTIMGLRDVERFHRIAEALSERETLTPEEQADLEKYGAQRLEAGALTP